MRSFAVPPTAETTIPGDFFRRLLRGLGRDRFVDDLHGTLLDIAPLSRCGVFVFDECARPTRILPTATGNARVSPAECTHYLKRFFRFDSLRELMIGGGPSDETSLLLMRADEITQVDYRTSYAGVALSERLSLLRADEAGRWIALNLYRGQDSGSFSANQVERISQLAPVLGDIVQKHVELTRPPNGRSLERCRQRLQELDPTLTERELSVCSLILKGLTTNEIADDLKVRPSSVICYRKRAYARLNVANQKELHTRCF